MSDVKFVLYDEVTALWSLSDKAKELMREYKIEEDKLCSRISESEYMINMCMENTYQIRYVNLDLSNSCKFEYNELSETQDAKFAPKNLNSYQIQSDGSNSCGGASGTGLISAIPIDNSKLPTFILAANTFELKYDFKGIKGNSISECFPLICGTSTLVHDPNLDPIHGEKCTQFRTSMVRNGKVETGCYGDPHPDSANGWYPDPCAQTPQGCRSTSFYTNYGWYPCTAGEDEFNFKMPDGFPETKSRECNAFNSSSLTITGKMPFLKQLL